MSIFRTIGLIILGILLCPFFLIFFCPVMTPYILQSRVENACLKILMAILGFVFGLILIPLFILACFLYFLYYVTVRAFGLCGCEDSCDSCCSITGYPNGQGLHGMALSNN